MSRRALAVLLLALANLSLAACSDVTAPTPEVTEAPDPSQTDGAGTAEPQSSLEPAAPSGATPGPSTIHPSM